MHNMSVLEREVTIPVTTNSQRTQIVAHVEQVLDMC